MFRFGPRFFALDQVYDSQWLETAKKVAQDTDLGERIKEGVYTMLGGPNFETPAELRMLRNCGVDAVGKIRCQISIRIFLKMTHFKA